MSEKQQQPTTEVRVTTPSTQPAPGEPAPTTEVRVEPEFRRQEPPEGSTSELPVERADDEEDDQTA
jgi:hypothetical protein